MVENLLFCLSLLSCSVSSEFFSLGNCISLLSLSERVRVLAFSPREKVPSECEADEVGTPQGSVCVPNDKWLHYHCH